MTVARAALPVLLAVLTACEATESARLDYDGDAPTDAPPNPGSAGKFDGGRPDAGKILGVGPGAKPLDPRADVRGVCNDAPGSFEAMNQASTLDGVPAWAGSLPALKSLEAGYYFAFFASESCGLTAVVVFSAESLESDSGTLHEITPGLRWAITDLPDARPVRVTLRYGKPDTFWPPAGWFSECLGFDWAENQVVIAGCGQSE